MIKKYFLLSVSTLFFLHLLADKVLPALTDPFPPGQFTENGEVVGSTTEIVNEILKRMGYKMDVKLFPWERAYVTAKNGDAAILYAFSKSPEREKDFYFTDPIYNIQDVFFKRKKADISWRKMDDLKMYKIGATSGYNYPSIFLNAMKEKRINVELLDASKTPQLQHLRKLKLKRVDLVICEVNLCNYLIIKHREEFSDIDFIDKSIGPVRTFHVGFSKKWPGAKKLRDEFNKKLKKFKANGEHKPIFKKYGITGD